MAAGSARSWEASSGWRIGFVATAAPRPPGNWTRSTQSWRRSSHDGLPAKHAPSWEEPKPLPGGDPEIEGHSAPTLRLASSESHPNNEIQYSEWMERAAKAHGFEGAAHLSRQDPDQFERLSQQSRVSEAGERIGTLAGKEAPDPIIKQQFGSRVPRTAFNLEDPRSPGKIQKPLD